MSSKSKQNKAYPNIKIQPPLLALIHVVLAFVLAWLMPIPLAVPPLLQASGFLLVVFGFLLGTAALIIFRRTRKGPSSHGPVSGLVTSGIYRFSRNPVYLGFLLILIGISLNAGSYWGILLAPIMLILFNRLVIEPEEEYLAQKFGEEYRNFQAKVRRWL